MRTKLPLIRVFIYLLVLSGIITAQQAGDFDDTFDGDGLLNDFYSGTDAFLRQVIVQSDGKIVTAGGVTVYNNTIPPGTPDNDFGNNGVVNEFYSGVNAYLKSVTVQQDGKIVGAGSVIQQTADFAIVRFNPDGTPDSTFHGDGKVRYAYSNNGTGFVEEAKAVEVLPDGTILVAGNQRLPNSGKSTKILKLNPNGTLYPNFGSSGSGGVTAFTFWNTDEINDILPDDNGKFLVAGTGVTPNNKQVMVVAKFNSDGTFDGTFNGGRTTFASQTAPPSQGNKVLKADDGKYLVFGSISPNGRKTSAIGVVNANGSIAGFLNVNLGSSINFINDAIPAGNDEYYITGNIAAGFYYNTFVAKVRRNGTLVTSFGNSGRITFNIGSGHNGGISIVEQQDGKLIIAGNADATRNVYAVRINPDGSYDTNFGNNGIRQADYGTNGDKLVGSVISGENVVLAGSRNDGQSIDVAFAAIRLKMPSTRFNSVARLNSDGSPDNSFSGNGKNSFGTFSANKYLTDIISLPGGGYFAGGTTTMPDGSFYNSVYKLDDAGTPDMGWANNGNITFGYWIRSKLEDIDLQPDGKILVTGTAIENNGRDLMAVTRLNSDGTYDATFGNGGRRTFINSSFNQSQAFRAERLSNGKYLLFGRVGDNGTWRAGIARLNSDGTPDATFAPNGDKIINVSTNGSLIRDVVPAGNDNFYIGGVIYKQGGNDSFVALVDSDGNPVNSFGNNGVLEFSADPSDDGIFNLVRQADGTVIAAGQAVSQGDVFAARILQNGTLDNSFDSDGIKKVDLGYSSDAVQGLAISEDNYLLAGNINNGTNDNIALARILSESANLPGPVLESPYNGITGTTLLPEFRWGSVAGAAEYKLYISDNSQFNDPVVEFFVRDTSFQLVETAAILDNNTKYYWKAAALTASQTEFDSQVWHFTTAPEITVSYGYPGDGDDVYTSETTFTWYLNQAAGTLKYQFQLLEKNSTPSAADWRSAASFVTSSTFRAAPTLLGTKYYWRVNLLNASEEIVTYGDVYSFTTIGGATTPVQSYPLGGATVYTNSPNLYWWVTAQTEDLNYRVRYSTDNANWTETGLISGLYTQLNGLAPGKTYYWQVQSVYRAGTANEEVSVWSASASFETFGSGAVVQPYASYPAGGALLYTVSPYVHWYHNEAAQGLTYNVYYREGTSGPWTHAGTTNSLALQIPGLDGGISYQWKVTATNGNDSLSSAPESFVTAGGTSTMAKATYPLNDAVVYSNDLTVNWYPEGSTEGIDAYTVRWKEGSAPDGGWASYTDELYNVSDPEITSYEITDLNYGSTYYWAVAVVSGGSVSTFSEGSFRVAGGSTSIPELTYPGNGATVYTGDVTLGWYINGSSSGITEYEIVYSNSDVFATQVTSSGTSTFNSFTANGLTAGATYYWKVRSKYDNGQYSDWSNTSMFYVDGGATSPVQPLVGSPNNVTVADNSPQMTWVLPVAPASGTTYEVNISESSDMQNPVISRTTESTSLVADGLSKNKTYYWNVRSKNGDGEYSYYSASGSFVVGDEATGINDKPVVPEKFVVEQNYPNPFNPATTIRFAIPEAAAVSVKVYNMLGQEIVTLVNNEMSPGQYEVTWNGTDNSGNKVSTGAYIYRVIAGENVSVKKMLLLK